MELLSGLPNFGSMETFGARTEKRKVLDKKTAADVLPWALLSGLVLCFVGSATHTCTAQVYGSLPQKMMVTPKQPRGFHCFTHVPPAYYQVSIT